MRRIALGAVIALVLWGFACGTSSPPSQETGDDSSDAAFESSGNTFLDLLSLVPDTPETRQGVFLNDYARIRDLYGVTLPVSGADEQALLTYRRETIRPDGIPLQLSFISGFGGNQTFNTQNLAFGLQDVDAEVWVAPNDNGIFLELVFGNFDPSEANRLIAECDGCRDSLRQRYAPEQYKDLILHSWGDGLKVYPVERFTPPVADNTGRSMVTTASEDYLFRTASVQFAQELIDIGRADGKSLADVKAFSRMAEKLHELAAHSAFMTTITHSYDGWIEYWRRAVGEDQWQVPLVERELRNANEQFMVPYQAFALGVGVDDRTFVIMVVVHDSARDAEFNAKILRARLNNGRSIYSRVPYNELFDGWEIDVDADTVVAKLFGERAVENWFYDVGERAEPLLLHE